MNKDFEKMTPTERKNDSDWQKMSPVERMYAAGLVYTTDGKKITLQYYLDHKDEIDQQQVEKRKEILLHHVKSYIQWCTEHGYEIPDRIKERYPQLF